MIPLWVIPLILAAGSTAANYQGQKKVNKARTAALGEERGRRERKEKESAARAQSTADLLVKTAGDEKTRAAELEQRYAPDRSQPAAEVASGAPDAVRSALPVNTVADPRMGDRARARVDQVAKLRAQLGSFGDVMVGNQIAAGRNAQDIDAVNSGLRNWNQFVLPAQLNAANTKGRDWNTLGDALQLASTVTSMGALTAPAAGAQTAYSQAATAAADTTATNAWIAKELENYASGLKMPGVY